jgi:hypothetical protein
MFIFRYIISILLVATLASCGGGSDSSSVSPNTNIDNLESSSQSNEQADNDNSESNNQYIDNSNEEITENEETSSNFYPETDEQINSDSDATQAYLDTCIAAFNQTQQSAFQNALDAASAFGLSAPPTPMEGLPQAQDLGSGISGYCLSPAADIIQNETGNGIWSGYTTNSYGETSDTVAIFYDGNFVAVNYEYDEFYSGSYNTDGDTLTSSLINAYDWNGPIIGKGSLYGVLNEKSSIFANISGDSDVIANVSFIYETSISEASITYADLTGTWLGTDDSVGLAYAIAIDEQGFVAAEATDGCSVAGSVNIPQNNLNIFEVQLTITGNDCSVNGTYSGLGLLYEGEISMAYSNDNYGFAFDAVKLGQ